MQQYYVKLKNTFDRRNPEGYDTETLLLEFGFDFDTPRKIENIKLEIALRDPAATFKVYLMELHDAFGQHYSIVNQLEQLPFMTEKAMKFQVSVPIVSSHDRLKNLPDILRGLPERERVYDRKFLLDVRIFLEFESEQDAIFTETFDVENPYFGRYQWHNGTFTEPAKIVADNNFLRNALAQVSNELEQALLELFEAHKYEIKYLAEVVDGISYDILPHQRYAAISFRTAADYDGLEHRYSPAIWENYSLLEYRNCRSEKFKWFATWLFQLFFEIQASSEDFEDIEPRINDLLLSAIAEAVLRPSVAAKLRACGIANAPTITEDFDRSVEYIVSASDYDENPLNYCEFVLAQRKMKRAESRLRLDKF